MASSATRTPRQAGAPQHDAVPATGAERPLRVGFHAPMKHPDHPVPSGDRTIARLLLRALALAGCEAVLPSRSGSFNATGDAATQQRLEAEADAEAARILTEGRGSAPFDLWFTYHSFHKAPDLLGPRITEALTIPYVVAEGSRAPKQAAGPWARGHALAGAGLDRADLLLVLNPRDRPALEAARRPGQRIAGLAPFVDDEAWPRLGPSRRTKGGAARFLTVAMMRDGDKLASYAVLAEALARVAGEWSLDVVGDGPARARVEALFAPMAERVRFLGRIDGRDALARLYAEADLLLWPAVNEAIGMIFPEAALQGCPAVAGRFGGVPSVVAHETSGLLAEPGDAGSFAAAVERLLADRGLLARLGAGAAERVAARHSIAAAAASLRRELGALRPARSLAP